MSGNQASERFCARCGSPVKRSRRSALGPLCSKCFAEIERANYRFIGVNNDDNGDDDRNI